MRRRRKEKRRRRRRRRGSEKASAEKTFLNNFKIEATIASQPSPSHQRCRSVMRCLGDKSCQHTMSQLTTHTHTQVHKSTCSHTHAHTHTHTHVPTHIHTVSSHAYCAGWYVHYTSWLEFGPDFVSMCVRVSVCERVCVCVCRGGEKLQNDNFTQFTFLQGRHSLLTCLPSLQMDVSARCTYQQLTEVELLCLLSWSSLS